VRCGDAWLAATCLYCVVSLWNMRVCPHVVLSATLFQFINLRGYYVKEFNVGSSMFHER
jgi:hypothetical protein